mgnify:CR=1 FL=1
MIIPSSPFPVPAIASAPFYVGQKVIGSVQGYPVELYVEALLEDFPTMYPRETPFFIVSLEHLDQFLLSAGATQLPNVDVFWVSLAQGADRSKVLETLQASAYLGEVVLDRETLASQAANNPLLGGAWESVALQGAIALGFVSLLGFGLYAGITVRRSRLELGVLQAVGFSRRHVSLLLAAEGAFVGAIGVGVGAAVGAWLSRWTLGYMSVTAGGKPLAPPLVLPTEVWLLTLALAEVALAVLASVVLAMALAGKLRLHEVLRMEE